MNFGPIYDSHPAFNKKAVNTYLNRGYLPVLLSMPSFFDYGSEPGSPIYAPIKREFDKIYAYLMDPNNAKDHSLVLKYLLGFGCSDDKSFKSSIKMIDFEKLTELMRDGPTREKLLDLLYPSSISSNISSSSGGGGGSASGSDLAQSYAFFAGGRGGGSSAVEGEASLITIRVKCQGESVTIMLRENSTLGQLMARITSEKTKLSELIGSSDFELMSGFPPVVVASWSSSSSLSADTRLLRDASITNNSSLILIVKK